MDQAAAAAVLWKKFVVGEIGTTYGAHQEIVSKLKSIGQTEASSTEESDYILVFCPIMFEGEIIISAALENLLVHTGDKPIILVVMHHTFNPEEVVAPSREQVDNPNVYLTVDCLFHGDKLLPCKRNYFALADIQKFLGVSTSQNDSSNLLWKKFVVGEIGTTYGAHQEIVSKLKSIGQTEASSTEESDYILVFCPIMFEGEIIISAALENLLVHTGDKPIILVVMHHTFNPEEVVAPSREQVDNPNVYLTVDCLFHGDKLLPCKRNYFVLADIQKFLGVSTSQG